MAMLTPRASGKTTVLRLSITEAFACFFPPSQLHTFTAGVIIVRCQIVHGLGAFDIELSGMGGAMPLTEYVGWIIIAVGVSSI
jgi:hypothetical protein